MKATTTKLNLIDLKHLNKKEQKIFMELLGLNKRANETGKNFSYSLGDFISKSITLNNGDFAKGLDGNKILNILYSYFKSESKKYELRLICSQSSKSNWTISATDIESANKFYESLETKDNLERLEKSAKAKEKAKAKESEKKAKINAIADSKNVTIEVATDIYKKEQTTERKQKELANFTTKELLLELVSRKVIGATDIGNMLATEKENREIA